MTTKNGTASVFQYPNLFIRSQAFFHALVVAIDSSAQCGSSRSLAALGFPDNEAERFEQLRQLGVLIYVSCPESTKTNWVVELLQRTGAREAATLEGELAGEAVAYAAPGDGELTGCSTRVVATQSDSFS